MIIVEGFFDCIRLWQLGLTRTVALMGSTMSAAQEGLLREHTTADTRIILMLDEDDAGRAARVDIAARVAQRPVCQSPVVPNARLSAGGSLVR